MLKVLLKKKLTPLASESTSTNLLQPLPPDNNANLTNSSPRVDLAMPPRVPPPTSNSTNSDMQSTNDTPISNSFFHECQCRTMSPKITKQNIDMHSADACKEGILQNLPSNHRYPTRAKTAAAAATIQQLEAKQMKEHSPVTFNFNKHDVHNPPNELKCEHLILTDDKEV